MSVKLRRKLRVGMRVLVETVPTLTSRGWRAPRLAARYRAWRDHRDAVEYAVRDGYRNLAPHVHRLHQSRAHPRNGRSIMSTIDHRTPLQVLEDAVCKARVLKGIALLEEEHGPNWASEIDLDELELSSETHCVLGQLYHGTEVDEATAIRWAESDAGSKYSDATNAYDYLRYSADGYTRGIALIDGPLLDSRGAEMHGFDSDIFLVDDLASSTDAELEAMGVTRQMVESADEYRRQLDASSCRELSYSTLNRVWHSEIEARQ